MCPYSGLSDCSRETTPVLDIPGNASVYLECLSSSTVILAHTYTSTSPPPPSDRESFSTGFGNPITTYWLGNSPTSQLTSTASYKLRVDMWDGSGVYDYAEFSRFLVTREKDNFIASFGRFMDGTNGGGQLEDLSGVWFATSDMDNGGCVNTTGASWWYNTSLPGCAASRLTPGYGNKGMWAKDSNTPSSVEKELHKIIARIVSTLAGQISMFN